MEAGCEGGCQRSACDLSQAAATISSCGLTRLLKIVAAVLDARLHSRLKKTQRRAPQQHPVTTKDEYSAAADLPVLERARFEQRSRGVKIF